MVAKAYSVSKWTDRLAEQKRKTGSVKLRTSRRGRKPALTTEDKANMRYTHYRGLAQVSNWVRLKFAVMNLKKLTKWKFRSPAATVLALLSRIFQFFSQLKFPQLHIPEAKSHVHGELLHEVYHGEWASRIYCSVRHFLPLF